MPQSVCIDSKSLFKADTKFWDFNRKKKPPEDWKQEDLRLVLHFHFSRGRTWVAV